MTHSSLDQTIHIKVPVRMDLAGGTLDIWPIYHALENPCTVNVAIELWAEAWLRPSACKGFRLVSKDQNLETELMAEDNPLTCKLPLLALAIQKTLTPDLLKKGGLELCTNAMSPAGAGLGGSSALLAAMLSALDCYQEGKQKFDAAAKDRISARARDIESVLIHTPTGIQDYLGALYGGLNIIDFKPGGWRVRTFEREPWLQDLQECTVVYFSGQSRASAINNWEMFKGFYNKEPSTVAAFTELAAISRQVAEACEGGTYLEVIKASHKEWAKRLEIWPAIHSDNTNALARVADTSGALLTRVFGAGGGGVMASFCASKDAAQKLRGQLRPTLEKLGGSFLDARLNLGVDCGLQLKKGGK